MNNTIPRTYVSGCKQERSYDGQLLLILLFLCPVFCGPYPSCILCDTLCDTLLSAEHR
ncbi:MAG: hypothetical protein IJW40_03650 [Clostridia bacterium]|nr:hypothetical protein [Clostridia bacterium]